VQSDGGGSERDEAVERKWAEWVGELIERGAIFHSHASERERGGVLRELLHARARRAELRREV
jgi:hypothetical protein